MSYTELLGPQTTLSAATATDLLSATGMDITAYDQVSVQLHNNGANPITALAVYWSNDPAGSVWSAADASITLPGGSLAAGAVLTIERTEVCFRRMRISVTSALGSTVKTWLFARSTGRPV